MTMLQHSVIESGGYNIDRSLRFRSSASAYLSRTPASAGNRTTWTWSGWVKRGKISDSVIPRLFSAGADANNRTEILFLATDEIRFLSTVTGTSRGLVDTVAKYRDPSAWYHILVSLNAASTNVSIYINNVLQSTTVTTAVQNINHMVNSTNTHRIADYWGGTSNFDGYLAEVNFIDGQALTPSSFGQTDAVTGVWTPKKYAGTYGTNGFYLDFKDNTSATTLAYDKSGNGNNWTANNISTTAGATYDSMTDVPTLTSATAANYSTWNPINNGLGGTISNANLTLSGVSVVASRINSTIGVSSGKWYFETTLTTAGDYTTVGIGQGNITNQYPGNDALSYAQTLERATSINSNTQPAYGTALIGGDVFMCAFDLDNNKVFFGKNGTWFGTSNPETGANPAYTIAAGTYNAIARPNPSGFSTTAVLNTNFGQRPFSYTPPTGFKALNTFNLPDPVIKKPNQYMDATTYTGTGSSQTIGNGGGFSPDFVWTKSRSGAYDHFLLDSVRGGSALLLSNATSAEFTGTAYISSFAGSGFTIANTASTGINANGATYVGWQWKKGATPGFDIVTYTGTGSNTTVAHSLGVAPAMYVVKARNATGQDWLVYHKNANATPQNGVMILNATSAFYANSIFWNNTAPTSSVFSVGTSDATNKSSTTYVAYLFAEIAGFSKFGSYTGNGSADGPFVYCGFRPKYVMIKNATNGSDAYWWIHDSVRETYNVADKYLVANGSDAEGTSSAFQIDMLSNGFKVRGTNNGVNGNGTTLIFCAFAESPFKTSLAR